MNSDRLGAGIGHLERSSTVPADHNIAMCWVEVAYSQVMCVCALYGGLDVCRGRKLSPCAGGERGAIGAGGRALCGGVVLQFGRLLRWFGI